MWMPHYNPLGLKLTNIVRKKVHCGPNDFYDLQDSQNVGIDNETRLMNLILKNMSFDPFVNSPYYYCNQIYPRIKKSDTWSIRYTPRPNIFSENFST
jgi:hypothetical protein